MNNTKKILVIGSTNTDMVIKTSHLPRPGETILGGTFFMNPGGKGANQAVAASRLGGQVTFICKTGKDVFGQQSRQLFEKEGINTKYMLSDTTLPSGVALITVDSKAENCIAVASGANGSLSVSDFFDKETAIDDADIVLMQLEIPITTISHIASEAYKKNKLVILNPAPAQPLADILLQYLYLITPNETEAELISGVKITDSKSAIAAANKIREQGVENVIITLGSKGALISNHDLCEIIPSPKVEAIDTTAAGDVFNGALTVAISEGKTLREAVIFACNAASLSVTRIGAQSSAPYRNEVDNFKL